MKRIEQVYEKLKELCKKQYEQKGKIEGFSAIEIAEKLNIHRSNASGDLNKLYKENRIEKIEGKPVLYIVKENNISTKKIDEEFDDAFGNIIGADLSLKSAVNQARAAIIYPPNGLHTLLLGETGTGKSMFAETMYKYAKEIGKIKSNSPFVAFNCADYANNPQLLMAQLFGVRKGAYTGADKDRVGLIERANEGILFLDEVHRLPPEGQEMLFYLIDKGAYRRLGESQAENRASLLIICATTENADSALLKTFKRRIPMVIKLPALKERSFEERYDIIKHCFRIEATCIKKEIMITSNALKALLLYDCINNIGQLKSDIKLCCAKAFLDNILEREEELHVHSEDLPEYVLRGLFKYKEHREEVDKFANRDLIKFSAGGLDYEELESNKVYNFYDALEEKRKALEARGIEEKDIKLIMSLDIYTYLKKYILNIEKDNFEELYKVVDKDIVDIVDNFLKTAADKLHRSFSNKILFGLAMHITSSIDRIVNNKKIENHQLEDVKRLHIDEFQTAFILKEQLERKFSIKVPEDEVGFITMFLCMDREEEPLEERVGILVAMHGESAATSIADVANRLLGEKHAVGYNMPLDQKPEIALENLVQITKQINRGKGIVLLVDMGSLVFFGDMIYERTKIPVKTVEMVSTPMVLEGTRKALLNVSLEEVYDSCTGLSPYMGRILRDEIKFSTGLKQDVVVTACITGQGTAMKLKSILEQKLNIANFGIDIIPLDIETKEKFNKSIKKIQKEKSIISVVSAINPSDSEILYLSTSDVFNHEKVAEFAYSLDMIRTINNMREVLEENTSIDANKFVEGFKKAYIILRNLGVYPEENILIGLILHVACALERVLDNKELIHMKSNEKLFDTHLDELNTIKSFIKPIESAFNMSFSLEEYINIMKIVFMI